MAKTMTDSEHFSCGLKVVDKKGNPVSNPVVVGPSWLTDNTDLLALAPAADGLTCDVSAVGPLGDATVTFKGSMDVGHGPTDFVGTLAVTVGPGAATTVVLEGGPNSEQP